MAGKEHSAGRVLLIPKGVFTIGTNYTPLDFVAFGSNNYVCKNPTDGTKTPVEDTSAWQMLAAGFDSHNIAAEYSEEATYHSGDICISGGNLYKARQDINVAEAFTAEHWEKITIGHELTAIEEKIGTAALTTTATNLSGAVNEVKTATDTNASAITKLNSDDNMLVKMIYANANSLVFKAKRPINAGSRYTCFLCLTAQGTEEIGAYLIGINSEKDSIYKIHGIDATITRNGEEITVTFPKNYIYANGFVILPRALN